MWCSCGKLIIVPEDDDDMICASCKAKEAKVLREAQRESAKSFWNRTVEG